MDQDFHYYGTYYAARTGGYSQKEATLIGKASNFVDFFHEGAYGGYWSLIRDKNKKSDRSKYQVVGEVTNPRYTFQSGKLSTGVSPEDGLWCSYHFTPGNYGEFEHTPSITDIHGEDIAGRLPGHVIRNVRADIEPKYRTLLNRPLSPLSRALIKDTLQCVTDNKRLEDILVRATGGWNLLLDANREQHLNNFRLILLGVRSHVIADTWAHQDWSGISHEMNTYWDVNDEWGRQAIRYQDTGKEWHDVVLSASSHENLQAVPNGTSYLGHGWMGHFPDYSFAKYIYRPCWQEKTAKPLLRDNPGEYDNAWIELCSLFSQAKNQEKISMGSIHAAYQIAQQAIRSSCVIGDKDQCPRQHSSLAWMKLMAEANIQQPLDQINAKQEPDPLTVLPGLIDSDTGVSRYGTYYVDVFSELYLFHIAADYHFHFVREFLLRNKILDFEGSWSNKIGPLSPMITDLFNPLYKPMQMLVPSQGTMSPLVALSKM